MGAGVGKDHDLGPLAPLGLANTFTLGLFSEANVPSARPSCQSMWLALFQLAEETLSLPIERPATGPLDEPSTHGAA